MLACLIEISAYEATGTPINVRLASHDLPTLCHLGAFEWEPALIELPQVRYDFFGGNFNGQITAPTAQFSCAIAGVPGIDPETGERARFADARVRIWAGDLDDPFDAALGPLSLRFDGRLTAQPRVDDAGRIAVFEAAVQDGWADEPLLELFAGTGGIEGPADLTGQVKPLVLGNAKFCKGVLIDAVDNVYMVSNGAVQAVVAVRDRVAALGASAGDHADLAALLAAGIAPGSWATCLALGLVRLGAPPDGRISFDVSGDNGGAGGYVRLPGAMIARVAEIAGGTVAAASMARLDTARPFNLALQLSEQTSAREVIQRIADSVAAVAGVSLTGRLFAEPLAIGVGAQELNADGSSAIPVLGVEELPKAAPAWRLATEAELTFEVHSADEAAFEYRWQGVYSATRVYRLDDVVTAEDGRAFAYINAAPAAGEALPGPGETANAHWQLFGAADVTSQSQITFNDPQPFNIQASSAGVTTTDLTSVSRSITVYKGGVSLSSGVTIGTVSASPSAGITAAASVSGGIVTITLSKAAAAGSVTVPVIVGGVTYLRTVLVNRSMAAPISGGGSGGAGFSDPNWDNISSTTPTQVTDANAIVQSNASGELQFSFLATYDGSSAVVARAQYSLDGSSWTDAGSDDATGDLPIAKPGEESSGFLSDAFTQTGLTAATDYYVRLRCWRASGTGVISFGLPIFSVAQL